MEVTVVKGEVDYANKEGELLHIYSQSANLRFHSHLSEAFGDVVGEES